MSIMRITSTQRNKRIIWGSLIVLFIIIAVVSFWQWYQNYYIFALGLFCLVIIVLAFNQFNDAYPQNKRRQRPRHIKKIEKGR